MNLIFNNRSKNIPKHFFKAQQQARPGSNPTNKPLAPQVKLSGRVLAGFSPVYTRGFEPRTGTNLLSHHTWDQTQALERDLLIKQAPKLGTPTVPQIKLPRKKYGLQIHVGNRPGL
jgi:hypothetical protein